MKIRLARFGAKHKPYYRIVVANSEAPRDGRFVEQIGTYDPKLVANKVTVDEAKVVEWLKRGAQPTDTVRSFLKEKGLLPKKA
jgi:small subunit ribosomal protein S16